MLFECRHGKNVSRVESRARDDVSSETDRFCRKRSSGDVHPKFGERAVGSERDPKPVPRGARLSAVSSSDDDSAAALQLLPRYLLVAANGKSMQGAGGFSGLDGNAGTGPPDGEFVPATAFKGVE